LLLLLALPDSEWKWPAGGDPLPTLRPGMSGDGDRRRAGAQAQHLNAGKRFGVDARCGRSQDKAGDGERDDAEDGQAEPETRVAPSVSDS